MGRPRVYHTTTSYSRYKDCHRNSILKRRYGITLVEYKTMIETRDGRCDICKLPEPKKKTLAVDHDHGTGKVRGLLCSNCNVGLGYFMDNPNLLTAAQEYLLAHD